MPDPHYYYHFHYASIIILLRMTGYFNFWLLPQILAQFRQALMPHTTAADDKNHNRNKLLYSSGIAIDKK
jgi:hypothetical protein